MSNRDGSILISHQPPVKLGQLPASAEGLTSYAKPSGQDMHLWRIVANAASRVHRDDYVLWANT